MLGPEFLFNDKRLNKRAELCFSKLLATPTVSFPQVFDHSDQLQGFYRFMNNDRVAVEQLIDSMTNHTRSHLGDCREAIVIHDTTHVEPSGKIVKKFETSGGFFAHLSLLVNANNLKSGQA